MNILYLLIPLALLLGLTGLAGFLYAARSGQMDNLETPPLRALIDESEMKGQR